MRSKRESRHGNRPFPFRGLANIALAVLMLCAALTNVAQPWKSRVNELLGIKTTDLVRSDDPADYRYQSDYEDPNDLIDAEIKLNTRLAGEGAVLLKGDPAVGGTNVTLFGGRSGQLQYGGTMGGLVSAKQSVPLADALAASGLTANPTMVEFYQSMAEPYPVGRAGNGNSVDAPNGATVNEIPLQEYGAAQQSSYANYKDAAIIVLGRDATEGGDYYPGAAGLAEPAEFSQSATGNILSLSDNERKLIQYVKLQGFEKVIVLLNTANALEIEELKTDEGIDSILWIGLPGCYGTYGIANILNGSVLPSGHLTDTYAVNSAKAPALVNYGVYTFANADAMDTSPNRAQRARWYLAENESIYTGYKYYETRYYDAMLTQGNAAQAAHGESFDGSAVWNYDNEVSYAFGYGVEGSTFSEKITDIQMDWTGETPSTFTIEVKNTGKRAAKHVVQLYASVPYTAYDRANGVEKAAIQLLGYGKTGESGEADFTQSTLLDPGERETVQITFNAEDMMSYDSTHAHDGVVGAYRLEAGNYWFATGNGAHEAVNAVLRAQDAEQFSALATTGVCEKQTLAQTVLKTESNGVPVQNQLADGDLNRYDCGVTLRQLTRSDWVQSWPQEITSLTATEEMIHLLQNSTYVATAEQAAYTGPTEFVYGADHDIDIDQLVGLAYNDPLYTQALEQVTLKQYIENYLAKLSLIESLKLCKRNGSDSPFGIISTIGMYTQGSIVEVDETDPAYGYETNVYVSPNIVAAAFSHLLAGEQGRLIGNDALWTGIHSWNAPGLNNHRTQYNGRNLEYYAEDAVLGGTAAADMIRSAQSYGLITGVKHFALNDQETNRDGIAVFFSEQAARENELRGFQLAVRDGGANCLMTAFNRIGCTHASASQGLCNGILRGEWGWNGYLITDSVKSSQYFQPTECLLAGNDLMLGGAANGEVWNYDEEHIKQDPVIQSGLREAFHRYLYTAANSSMANGITDNVSVLGGLPWWQTMLYTGMMISGGFLCVFLIGWAVVSRRKRNTKREAAQ